MSRHQEARARRRIVVSIGLLALAVASATACIFDKSTYQGGGRVDRGAEVKTAEPTASSAPQPTATPTATATDDGSVRDALVDAGDG